MTKPRIVVTGATGKTGSVVVSELLKAGYVVRAIVHREDGRSARLKAQGAEIAVADMSDVERVANALKDVAIGFASLCSSCSDRELRRPFPSVPQSATDSKVWRREHAITDNSSPAALGHGKPPVAATSRGQSLEF